MTVQLLDRALIARTLERARLSARLRSNHNFHPSDASNPHRFLNAFVRGTYAAPHRHISPPKPESFVMLQGQLALFVFDDHGQVSECLVLGGETLGADVAEGTWHTLVPLSEEAVCFEVKPGPYDPATDKEFAPWAPREGDAAAPAYLQWLQQLAEAAARVR
jgi:cupin fold WbuC family metalloprotein